MPGSTLAYLEDAARRGARGSVHINVLDCDCEVCARRATNPTLDQEVTA